MTNKKNTKQKTLKLKPIRTVRDLIQKVSGIDWAAGVWLSKTKQDRKSVSVVTLTRLFFWKDSPQGFLFWRGINEKLRVYYALPTEINNGKRK